MDRIEANKVTMDQYKSKFGCSLCTETHPKALTFKYKGKPVGEKIDTYVFKRHSKYYQYKYLYEHCDVMCLNCVAKFNDTFYTTMNKEKQDTTPKKHKI